MATISAKEFLGGKPATVMGNESSPEYKKTALQSHPTFGQNISSAIQKRGEGVYGAITGTSPESQGESPLVRGVQATGEAFGAVTDVASEIGNRLIPQGVKDRFQQQVEEGRESPLRKLVTDTASKAYDELGTRLTELEQSNPEAVKKLESTLKVAEGAGEIAGSILTADQAAQNITTGAKVTDKGVQKVKQFGSNVTNKIGEKTANYAENSIKNEWVEPTKVPKATYKKSKEIYDNASAQGHDISDTLVKNKISVADHIDNGNFSTVDTADSIRSDAGKMSKDFLRPSLEKADLSVPRTPVQEVVNEAVNKVNANRMITQETKDAIIEKLNASKGALERQFPEGMGLTDMHDEKILRDLNSKYSPIGDIATNNEAVKNKALADSLRGTLEAKAPSDLPIKEFNAELSKQYQAADYLESLNNKKAPVSIASRIAKTSAKVVGAVAGEAIGGGLMGGLAGYHLGGAVEGLLEGLPNPLKAKFLQNLEVSNPEAFQKVQNYLSNLETSGSVAQPMSSMSKSSNILTRDITPESIQNLEGKVKESVSDYIKNPKLGASIEDVTKSNPLIQEAKKYKSAEEFVKAQEIKPTTDNVTNRQAKSLKVGDYVVTGEGKYAKITDIKTKYDKLLDTNSYLVKMDNGSQKMLTTDTKSLIVSKLKDINSKSQLTDIWNKANKK